MDLESLLEHQSSLQSKMTSLYTMLYVFISIVSLIEFDACTPQTCPLKILYLTLTGRFLKKNRNVTNLKSEKLCFQAKFAASGGRFSAALQYDLIHFNLGGECQQ